MKDRSKNKKSLTKPILMSVLFVLFLSVSFFFLVSQTNAASQWVSDPATCNVSDAINFPGQNCDPTYICGDNSGIAQCYDTTSFSAPAVIGTSNILYSASYPNGGYILNCYAAQDSAAPYCDNNTNYWCNRSTDCYTTQRRDTVCTASTWAASTCGSCRTGYADCDAGGDSCEIQFGVTNYPTGANNNYADCLTAQCDSNWLDCDAGGIDVGNGCEIQEGATCTVGALTGTWSGCTCLVGKQYFETGTEAGYATTDPLLWGVQHGSGDLIHFGNGTDPDLFIVTNDGSVQLGQITAPVPATDQLYNVAGELYWNGAAIGGASGDSGWTDDGTVVRLTTITDSVGIATTNPLSKLHIADPTGNMDQFRITSNSGDRIMHVDMELDGPGGSIKMGDIDQVTYGEVFTVNHSDGTFNFTGDGSLGVSIGNTNPKGLLDIGEGMLSTPSGDVSVVLTYDGGDSFFETQSTDMSEGLIMHGDFVLGDSGIIRQIGSSGYAIGWEKGLHIFNDDLEPIIFTTNGSERMRVDDNGRVGVGTDIPESLFHIQGGSTGDAVLRVDSFDGSGAGRDAGIVIDSDSMSGSQSAYLYFYNSGVVSTRIYGSTSGTEIFVDGDKSFTINTNASRRFTILGDGNVGIATANPKALLDIGEGMISTPSGDSSILLTHDGGDSYIETASTDMSEGLLMHGPNAGVSQDSGVIRQLYSSGYTAGWDKGLHIFNENTDPIILRNGGGESIHLENGGMVVYKGSVKVMQVGNASGSYPLQVADVNGDRLIDTGTTYNSTGGGDIEHNISLGDLDELYNGTWFGIDTGDGLFGFNNGDIFFGGGGTTQTAITRYQERLINGSNYVGFRAPDSILANVAWILPNADGTNGQVLSTDGAGNLSWGSGGGAATLQEVADYTIATDGYVYADFGAVSFEDDGGSAKWEASAGGAFELALVAADNTGFFLRSAGLNPTQMYIKDSRTGVDQQGVVYAGDYSANFTDRSLVDMEYVNARLGLFESKLAETVIGEAPGTNQYNRSFVVGSPQLDDDGDAAHDARMFFEKATGAFRVGQAQGTQWNSANRGVNSFAAGINNTVSGANSFAAGSNNSTANSGVFMVGDSNTVTKNSSVTIGRYNNASGNNSVAIGSYVNVHDYGEIGFGINSVQGIGSSSSLIATNQIFHIGNGTNTSSRSNAMTVLFDGKVGLGTTTPSTTLELSGPAENLLKINGTTSSMALGYDGDFGYFDYNSSDVGVDLNFMSYGNDVMVLTAAGEIGIGNTNPQAMFHINNGTAVTQKYLYISDNGTNNIDHLISSNGTFPGVLTWDINELATGGELWFINNGEPILSLSSSGVIVNSSPSGGMAFRANSVQGTAATFSRYDDDGVIISLRQDNIEEGTITVSGSTVSYNAFTGSHYTWTDEKIEKGMLVELTGKNKRLHDRKESEILYGIKVSSEKNSAKILGSYLSIMEPSKKPDLDNPSLVMAEGNGVLWIADTGSDIEAGDYLISSDFAGHAQKMDPDFALNYVFARAAEDIDWSDVKEKKNGVKHKMITVFFDGLVVNTQTVDLIQSSDSLASKLNLKEMPEDKANNIKKKLFGNAGLSREEQTQVGQVIVDQRRSSGRVEFVNGFEKAPIVMLTLASDSNLMRYYVSDVTTEGFKVNIYPTQRKEVYLNWQAFPSMDEIMTTTTINEHIKPIEIPEIVIQEIEQEELIEENEVEIIIEEEINLVEEVLEDETVDDEIESEIVEEILEEENEEEFDYTIEDAKEDLDLDVDPEINEEEENENVLFIDIEEKDDKEIIEEETINEIEEDIIEEPIIENENILFGDEIIEDSNEEALEEQILRLFKSSIHGIAFLK